MGFTGCVRRGYHGRKPSNLSFLLCSRDSKHACQVEKEAYAALEGGSRGLADSAGLELQRCPVTDHCTCFLYAAQAPKDEAEVQVGGLVSAGSHQRAMPLHQQQLQQLEHAQQSLTHSPYTLVWASFNVTELLLLIWLQWILQQQVERS